MEKLSEKDIQNKLKTLPEWRLQGVALHRDFEFKDFVSAMVFINKVAETAEKLEHHPEIINNYNKVSLRFSTHDAGGITEKDFDSAREVNKLAAT